MSRSSGVELYKRGLQMKRDPSTTEIQWAEWKAERDAENTRYAFRNKLINKIEVIRCKK